jgi:hypothetical protein
MSTLGHLVLKALLLLRGEQPNARATDGVTKRHEPASRALVTAPVVTPVGRRLC